MITIDIDDAGIQATLDRVARAVTDLTPVMQEIGEEMVVATRERFTAGTSPDGVAWAHVDTFAWRPSAKPGRPKGGAALGLRAAWAMLQARYDRRGKA